MKKKCTQCGLEKDETEFYKDKRHQGGRRYNCKACQNIVRGKWREKNPEKTKYYCTEYYERNKEKWIEREKNLSIEKRAKKREFSKQYYLLHKDDLLERQKKRHRDIPVEKRKKYSQDYYERNKKKICLLSRKSYENLSEDIRQKRVAQVRAWRNKNSLKAKAWSALGNALVRGEVSKPLCCESCKCVDEHLHGHHEDYNRPLDVQWLCHKCHMSTHREKKKL